MLLWTLPRARVNGLTLNLSAATVYIHLVHCSHRRRPLHYYSHFHTRTVFVMVSVRRTSVSLSFLERYGCRLYPDFSEHLPLVCDYRVREIPITSTRTLCACFAFVAFVFTPIPCHLPGPGATVTASAIPMDYPLTPSISRSNSNRDRDRERDDDDTETLADTSNTTNTSSRSPRIRLGGYGTATGLAASSSTSSFPLISSTSDSGSTSTAFLAPRLTRHSSNPNTNGSTLPTPSHSGINIDAHSSSHSHRATSHPNQHPIHNFLYPMDSYGHAGISSRSSAASVSMCSTAANSPINSRAGSPSPFFYSSAGSISSTDEDESEPPSPYLNSVGGTVGAWWREDPSSTSRRRWPWLVNGGGGFGGLGTHPRRRRRMNGYGFRMFKRFVRRLLCRRPFIPKQPSMIVRISLSFWLRNAERSPFFYSS